MSNTEIINITTIIPIHKLNADNQPLLKDAIGSIIENRVNATDINIKTVLVCPPSVKNDLETFLKSLSPIPIKYTILLNDGETDYCSQINFAAKNIDTEWFSILELDDVYTPYWFKSFKNYLYSKEDVSLFLPINVQYEEETPNIRQFCNEIVWANEFSKEMGYIDFECLENFVGFNLTGGIFNTNDFNKIGGFKPSIKVAFNYEFLLRLTHKNLKVFVIPKEGYIHCLNRKDSLTDEYNKHLSDKEVKKWFEHAKCEYPYIEDRKTAINTKVEQLK